MLTQRKVAEAKEAITNGDGPDNVEQVGVQRNAKNNNNTNTKKNKVLGGLLPT